MSVMSSSKHGTTAAPPQICNEYTGGEVFADSATK